MITFYFNDTVIKKKLIIKKATFSVYRNSITVLDGANGAGKTLLLKRIFFDLRKRNIPVTYVEQDNSFFLPKQTVAQNITMKEDDASLTQCKSFLAQYGLAHLIQHPVDELSGGEKRLLCIFRAIYHSQEGGFILIDEPTNDLSIEKVAFLLQCISTLAKNRTFLIATHDDRVREISKDTLVIQNHEVISSQEEQKEECDVERTKQYKEEIKQKKEEFKDSFFRKCFIYNIITPILCVILIAFSFLLSSTNFSQYKKEELRLLDNQVEIFTIDSIRGSDIILKGAIPISALSVFTKDLNNMEKMKLLKQSLKKAQTQPFHYNLSLAKSKLYDLYILEVIDLKNRQFIDLLDMYVCRQSQNSEEDIKLITKPYFIIANEMIFYTNNKVKFDKNEYEKMVDSEFGKKDKEERPVTYITLTLKEGVSFEEFASSQEIQSIVNGNYYIFSNETSALYVQIMNLTMQNSCLFNVILISVICLLIDAFSFYLVMKRNEKTIKTLFDVGMEKNKIKKNLYKKYNQKIPYIACVFILSAGTTMALQKYQVPVSISNYVVCFVVGIAFLAMKKMKTWLLNYKIKQVLSWRSR